MQQPKTKIIQAEKIHAFFVNDLLHLFFRVFVFLMGYFM